MSEDEWNWNQELMEKIQPSPEEQAQLTMGGSGEFGTPQQSPFGASETQPPSEAPENIPAEETPTEPAGAETTEPQIPNAPESVNFYINSKDSKLLQEWQTMDSVVQHKYKKK